MPNRNGLPSGGSGGGSGGGGAGDTCLIYQQGGPAQGPVVFNDFDELYARFQALKAASGAPGFCFRFGMDDSFVDPARITFPSSVYDVEGVTFFNARTDTAGFVFLDTSGAQFVKPRALRRLQIRHNSAVVPFSYPGGGLLVIEGALLFNDGASPTTPAIGDLGSGDFLAIRGDISLSEDSGEVIEVPTGATLSMAFGFQEIGRATIRGGGVWLYAPINDAFYNPDQPNFSGLFLPFNFNMNYVDPPAVATAAKAATALERPTALHRYDTSGGAITQPLPSAANRPGHVMEFRRDGASALDLDPSGSESVGGGGAGVPLTVADGSTVRLIADGSSNYIATVLE